MPVSKSDIVRHCFEAYAVRQRGMLEELLAEDFRFTSPYDDAIDRNEYFARCWPTSEHMREVEVETVCETGDKTFVRYHAATRDGKEFRNTEVFTFAGGKVRSVEVYFGATYRDGVFLKQPQ